MKAIAVERDDSRPHVIETSMPTPSDDEALVRTLRVGVDGTDFEVIRGNHGGFPAGDDYHVLGHEAVGVVEDPNGTALEAGQVVVPTVRRPPGDSNEYFERGEPDMAPPDLCFERGIDGAHGFMAEYFTSPAEYLVPISEEDADVGVLVEPMSNAVKAIEHAYASRSAFEWRPESALVLGNGPLGLLALALLGRSDDFRHCYCLGRRDRPDPTIDVIQGLDATYIDSRETPVADVPSAYRTMDFVFEATGHAKHAYQTIDALAPNGVGALLGIPEDWSFEIDGGRLHSEFVLHNKALIGSVNSHLEDFEAANRTLAELPEWFREAIVTDVFTPEEVDDAFTQRKERIKTVIEFSTRH